jgi:hypothetical protein
MIYVVDVKIELEAASPEEAEDVVVDNLDANMPVGCFMSVEKVSELTNG